ncbi:MAG: RBBP9/YdeN family alpha/beta hydrolase [Formosimonas sp.]
MNTRVLILPGYQNSSPQHWQSLWAARGAHVQRVMQHDWDNPMCGDWYAQLKAHIMQADGPVVLAAHSLGCLLTAHLVRQADESIMRRITGALLVAPPDPAGAQFPRTAQGFAPLTTHAMPFASHVVASTDDAYGSFDFAQNCAHMWGSNLHNLGTRGHINADSGLGDWPWGWGLLEPWLND